MARFTIYTYLFKPINEPFQPELFSPDVDAEESMDKKQEIFSNFFKGEQQIRFNRSNQRFDHLVVAQGNGIIVLQIANNTQQVHEQKFNRWTEEDHPSLFVLIDNRSDRQVIAIENRAQAFGDTQTVANILEESFNRRLYRHRLQVQVNAKYHAHEFWDVVSQYEQGIASVTFKFPYPNMPAISDMVGEFYTDLDRRTNSEPKTTLTTPKTERMRLEQDDEILQQMIKAASASGKLIMMRPKGAQKWRKIGLETPVQEELSEQALKDLNQLELMPKKWKAIMDFLDNIQTFYY